MIQGQLLRKIILSIINAGGVKAYYGPYITHWTQLPATLSPLITQIPLWFLDISNSDCSLNPLAIWGSSHNKKTGPISYWRSDSLPKVSGFWLGLCSQTFQQGSATSIPKKHSSPITPPWNVTFPSSWHWGLAVIIKKVQVCWQFKPAQQWHGMRLGGWEGEIYRKACTKLNP